MKPYKISRREYMGILWDTELESLSNEVAFGEQAIQEALTRVGREIESEAPLSAHSLTRYRAAMKTELRRLLTAH